MTEAMFEVIRSILCILFGVIMYSPATDILVAGQVTVILILLITPDLSSSFFQPEMI